MVQHSAGDQPDRASPRCLQGSWRHFLCKPNECPRVSSNLWHVAVHGFNSTWAAVCWQSWQGGMHGELSAYPLPFKLYFGIFQGDSGAPLTHESNHGQNILIGFFSWALGCARVTLQITYQISFYLSFCSLQEGIYGAYTKVSHYRAWIEEKMTNPKFCSGGADAWSTE